MKTLEWKIRKLCDKIKKWHWKGIGIFGPKCTTVLGKIMGNGNPEKSWHTLCLLVNKTNGVQDGENRENEHGFCVELLF